MRAWFKRVSTSPMTAKVAIWTAISVGILFFLWLIAMVINLSVDLNHTNDRLDTAQAAQSKLRTSVQAQQDALAKANHGLRAAGKPTVHPVTPPPEAQAGPQGEQGPAGPPGRGATDAQVSQSVRLFCLTTNKCRGADGVPGKTGPRGPVGPVGPQGEVGATGPAGPKGAPGADGAKGSQGPAGDPGATGPAGPPGPQGDPGPAGPPGADATFAPFDGGCGAKDGYYIASIHVTRDTSGALAMGCEYGALPTFPPTPRS
jgi:hypothetical protein